MRSTARSLFCLLLIGWVVLPGCRRGEPAADAAPVAAAPTDPWGSIPPDSLYGATALENLTVREVELELRGVPRGWNGMRIAVLSDLLLGIWPDNASVAEAAVRRAVELDPDLVVLLGDFVALGGADVLDGVLGPLRGRPTLAVLGVRDVAAEGRADEVVGRLQALGITVLRNQTIAFARGADTAFIAGIDPAFAAFAPAQQAQLFAGLPEGAATPLLLSHLPTVLPRLTERRFPAVLAGHTFCGTVDAPGTPRLAALQEETLAAERVPRTTRLFRHAENTLFVTCGLGYSFMPARFAAPPEIALVTLIRIPEPRAEGAADTLQATPQVAPETPGAEQPAAAPEPEPQ